MDPEPLRDRPDPRSGDRLFGDRSFGAFGDRFFAGRFDAEDRFRLDDELIGLDRDDPEVLAFSEHLRRTHRVRPGFTVEGYLSGVADFADGATRAQGLRRLAAVVVVGLILLGVAFTVWEAAVFILSTLL